MSTCRSCGAPIVWARAVTTDPNNPRTAVMPVDEVPVAGGNLRLIDGVLLRFKVVGSTIDLTDPTDDGTRYTSHYATCPDATEWRNR